MSLDRTEEYMSESQLAHFERLLILEEKKTLDEISSIPLLLKEIKENACRDEAGKGSRNEEEAKLFAVEDRAKQRVRAIKMALTQINLGEDGQYGYCAVLTCGDEIGLDRMSAAPTATMCVHCQSLYERQAHTNINNK